MSEHGKGNAIDLRAFTLADGRTIGLTDMTVPKDLRSGLRESACHRFTTVLGPGSDGHHEGHIHLDLAERRQRLPHLRVGGARAAAADRGRRVPGFRCRPRGRRPPARPLRMVGKL